MDRPSPYPGVGRIVRALDRGPGSSALWFGTPDPVRLRFRPRPSPVWPRALRSGRSASFLTARGPYDADYPGARRARA